MHTTLSPEARVSLAASRPESDAKPIGPGGRAGMICDTPEAIERFRMIAVLKALELEVRVPGMKTFSRASVLAAAQRLYGVKARRKAAAALELRALMVGRGIITAREGEQ